MTYWAHSDANRSPDEEGHRWQPLSEHLAQVAALARELAERATAPASALSTLAYAAGMLHDYGKYQECFQRMLHGGSSRCPHAIYGAIALRCFDEDGCGTDRKWAMPAVCAIAAHHAGLKDFSEHECITDPGNPAFAAEREIAQKLLGAAATDFPEIRSAFSREKSRLEQRSVDMQTRMLLSCLVDADRLNTAGRLLVQQELHSEHRLEQMNIYLDRVADAARKRGTAASVLNVRAQVQQHCSDAAKQSPGVFSLCVPTGGGKTLGAMRFALEHAAHSQGKLRRVIVVIPYLSIIEQNAKIYADVFGPEAVLEHHSGAVTPLMRSERETTSTTCASEEDEISPSVHPRTIETENWDAPVIVTTSVRFFESLFSNRPSDLRRIHNIARSVIILDEVQTIPRRLLAPLLGMLRELAEEWGCSVVLSTATQPAFEARNPRQTYLFPFGSIKPIIPGETSAAMARTLQRVQIDWEIEDRIRWEELATRLAEQRQVLCVVNLRDHAATVFDGLRTRLPSEEQTGLFHLSTRMCAQHRLRVLDEIRHRLGAGLTCRIVSTQLIEAGVDLSVPIAFRALGPLDSIIQVAGRVDREGTASAAAGAPAGKLIVFRPEDERYPGMDYKAAAAITQGVLDEFESLQTDHLRSISDYFQRYYESGGTGGRGEHLADMRQRDNPYFAELADAFEMIESRTATVFVPYGEGASLLRELADTRQLDRDLLRKLQRYTVSLQRYEFEAAKSQGLFEIWSGSDLWTCDAAQYSAEKGLLPQLPAQAFVV
ncbi:MULTISPECIES: CRISPR-associated helicase/endonuclease Cas3 [Acidobacterium]|uniref:CRISPR-associated helicase Cas3 n=1 Tax=Acidobacterium capsulatum (strain ATCC 51196 / DSM 11244 / BCRC 80197 / JCM 7670 / NBRC 15755 / NCIMB 13165 / 161) TaxID=240015 RepID=C1F2C1_ACIC5|nr:MULTISPECIES: CRISPR-associated helicase/endonuclease Cas3 [Acidobacterium]ACO31905.1 CRISPR-associated helicase Cas3 [Acidobacterium capsulatum ATCC 51196]HCT60036.1 CRISPR-associated helicase/endonuclease Cas3 [Acidobacterium sp.]